MMIEASRLGWRPPQIEAAVMLAADVPEGAAGTLALVLTTEASQDKAEALARVLLERNLVACATLFPVQSLYRWQGRLQKSKEVQILLKTDPARLGALQAVLLELHSYDTPEWIHWTASTGGAYGTWCAGELGSG
jgi:periplasmic divalent cation tolerance protein